MVSDDEDHGDTRLEQGAKWPGKASKGASTIVAVEQSSKPDNPTISAFLSERAQLEKERRERQKRMRSQAGLQDSEEEFEERRPSKRQHFSSSLRGRTNDVFDLRSSVTSYNSSRHSSVPVQVTEDEEQLFVEGELRQTATQHAEPRRDGLPTFRLTQILGKVQVVLH